VERALGAKGEISAHNAVLLLHLTPRLSNIACYLASVMISGMQIGHSAGKTAITWLELHSL
jgi:hypothetical protein